MALQIGQENERGQARGNEKKASVDDDLQLALQLADQDQRARKQENQRLIEEEERKLIRQESENDEILARQLSARFEKEDEESAAAIQVALNNEVEEIKQDLMQLVDVEDEVAKSVDFFIHLGVNNPASLQSEWVSVAHFDSR